MRSGYEVYIPGAHAQAERSSSHRVDRPIDDGKSKLTADRRLFSVYLYPPLVLQGMFVLCV